MSQRMSDVIEQYMTALSSQSERNTINTRRHALDQILAHTGNIQIKSLTPRHFDEFFAKGRARGLSVNTLNVQRTAARQLIEFAQDRRYIGDRTNPVRHIKQFQGIARERLRVPQRDFARVLDCAAQPRDRILVAIGLYLFLRSSEITTLRVGDVDLDSGTVQAAIWKGKQRDTMPICAELDAELRRWFKAYQEDQEANLRPEWYLVPSHGAPKPRWDPAVKRWTADYGKRNMDPTHQFRYTSRRVQAALVKAGYEVRLENGKSAMEGVHTLRRSGARALFDKLAANGYDGALRTVQAMLHHKEASTTEIYLGMNLDRKTRDELLRGRNMFDAPAENVVTLRPVKEN